MMKIINFGLGLLGVILFLTGLTLIFTDIDPLLICFKQCEIPKVLAYFLGVELFKILNSALHILLGMFFLVTMLKKMKK